MSIGAGPKERLFNGTFPVNITPWTQILASVLWVSPGELLLQDDVGGSAEAQYAFIRSQPPSQPSVGNLAPGVEILYSWNIISGVNIVLSTFVGSSPGASDIVDVTSVPLGVGSITFTTSAPNVYLRWKINVGGGTPGNVHIDSLSFLQATSSPSMIPVKR